MSKKIVIKVNNQEFDYDKLAEAIVKAEKKANELENIENPKVQLSFKEFLYTIWCIITNKKQTNGTMASGMLGLLTSITFNTLAVFAILISIACIGGIIYFAINGLLINIIQFCVCILGSVFSALFALILRASANEISVEKDRNYIVSLFSAIVGFAALVIALVSLLKGVG